MRNWDVIDDPDDLYLEDLIEDETDADETEEFVVF